MGTSTEKCNNLFKVVLIGESGAGKTSLIKRYNDNQLSPICTPTTGTEFSTKVMNLNGITIETVLWDCKGKMPLHKEFYKAASGAMLVYDSSSYNSFDKLGEWLRELKKLSDTQLTVLLVGTKSDLVSKQAVTEDDVRYFTDRNCINSFTTSIHTKDENKDNPIEYLIKEIYNKENMGRDGSGTSNMGPSRKRVVTDSESDESVSSAYGSSVTARLKMWKKKMKKGKSINQTKLDTELSLLTSVFQDCRGDQEETEVVGQIQNLRFKLQNEISMKRLEESINQK